MKETDSTKQVEKVFELIREHSIEFVDLRFTDPKGKWHHTCQHVNTIDEDSFIEMLSSKEFYDEVVRSISALKDIYSYTLSYRFCDEMEVEEIAKLLGVSEKTIYTRIERGKKLLLDALNMEKVNA